MSALPTSSAVPRGAGAIHRGAENTRDLELSCDVVVVGSGAGGAVVATELALAGQHVIVLEEGPHVTAAEHGAMRPSESIRHVWRDAAMTIAWPRGDTPAINVTAGRVVGGSSTLTGGVCFRVPEHVHDVWLRERGLPADLGRAAMEPCYDAVEQAMHVEEVPAAARSRGAVRFEEGMARGGHAMFPMRRNTHGCEGEGRCNFGCPHRAKQSVDQSYLPRALAAGAEVYADCLVERILFDGDRAVGVEGFVLDNPRAKRRFRLRVRARRVVVACGGMHSPVLLARSGVGKRSGHLGRHLTLHPAFRMIARFDEPVHGWKGAMQASFSDAFHAERITLTGLFIPQGVMAATMPGAAKRHVERARNLPHLAMFGGLIHDEGGGQIRPGFGREPILTYRMAREDRAVIPVLMRRMAEAFFEAGARECYLPVLGMEPVDADALRRLDLTKIPAKKIECSSQHPLGSCRMSATPESGVVDPEGRVWGTRELYVADGSVVPTSLGVNPQIGIMAMATRLVWRMRERPLV
jgi:choline dehydrogenase-like flavoprotein